MIWFPKYNKIDWEKHWSLNFLKGQFPKQHMQTYKIMNFRFSRLKLENRNEVT